MQFVWPIFPFNFIFIPLNTLKWIWERFEKQHINYALHCVSFIPIYDQRAIYHN